MPTLWNQVPSGAYPGIVTDPYFEWAQRTEFAYFDERVEHWTPLIVELRNTTAERFALGKDWTPPGPPDAWKKWLRIPSAYAKPSKGLAKTRFCTATVRPRFFAQLQHNATLRNLVKRFQVGLPIIGDTDNGPPPVGLVPMGPPIPGTVVTGIIDDALAFAHERFRKPADATRIWFFWDQDSRWDALATAPWGGPPLLFGYGRELRKHTRPGVSGIDDLIKGATHAGVVDEDEVYRVTGHLDCQQSGHLQAAWRTAHGTHVADLACGDDPAAALTTRPIVCVQLPGGTTRDTSGSTLAVHALDALRYILERTDRIAAKQGGVPLPVVVNLSYGLFAGPHDGTSLLEAAIDDVVSARNNALPVPMRVVLPAGNSHLARCHAGFRLAAIGSERRQYWRVQPDDATPSFLEIWLPQAAAQAVRVRVKIRTPWGDESPWINEGNVYVWQPGANVLCEARYLSAAQTGTRAMILVSLAPTTTDQPNLDIAPSGVWRIRVRNRGPATGIIVDAWIQRDDTPYGYPVYGRQSHFEDRADGYRDDAGREIEDDTPASYIRRAGSINAIATGGEPLVIGGCTLSDLKVAKYSSGGPIVPRAGGVPPPRAGFDPDALAVSEYSPACDGVLAAGSRSNSTVEMNGTSVAAPQITRWIADRMAAGLSNDRAAVQQLAQLQEAGPRPTQPPYPPYAPRPTVDRGGAGRIVLPSIRRR